MSGCFGVLALLLLALHAKDLQWRSPGAGRWLMVMTVLATWVALVRWARRRHRRTASGVSQTPTASSIGPSLQNDQGATVCKPEVVRVFHASQTGVAAQLAQRTVSDLQAAGVIANGDSFDHLDIEMLQAGDPVLFVVSTTGEGDPPDSALRFCREVMRQSTDLTHLRFGLLALGDSDYEDFCGFGRSLLHWLHANGAKALFDPVEVDRVDGAALRHWQHHLAMLCGSGDLPDWNVPDYQHWCLIDRRHLNPGSIGGACFHLTLKPPRHDARWCAGDLVEVGPCHAPATVSRWLARHGLDGDVLLTSENGPVTFASWLAHAVLPDAGQICGLDEAAVAARLTRLPHREYSIASLPEDGGIDLLVRRVVGPQGKPGIASSWLCEHAAIGTKIALRVRSNPRFHAPVDARPLILVGNGTGIAALRGLLKARVARGHHRNWLLFGERQRAYDFHYRDEIEQWKTDGRIERLDLAWSRDQSERVHVQHRLREAERELLRWIDAGAAIHVCGSLDGMAPGVDRVLHDVLGAACVEQLREQGRYRRDVY